LGAQLPYIVLYVILDPQGVLDLLDPYSIKVDLPGSIT